MRGKRERELDAKQTVNYWPPEEMNGEKKGNGKQRKKIDTIDRPLSAHTESSTGKPNQTKEEEGESGPINQAAGNATEKEAECPSHSHSYGIIITAARNCCCCRKWSIKNSGKNCRRFHFRHSLRSINGK